MHKIISTLLMSMLQIIHHEVMLLNMIHYPKCIEKSIFGSVHFLNYQHFLKKINAGDSINFLYH